MSKITISAQDWSQVLKSVVPHDSKSPHSWICMTKRDGGSRKIEVLLKMNTKNFFQIIRVGIVVVENYLYRKFSLFLKISCLKQLNRTNFWDIDIK